MYYLGLIFFAVLTFLLSVAVIYTAFMGFTESFYWLFLTLGIAPSAIVASRITADIIAIVKQS